MPVDIFFRKEEELDELEFIALDNCQGKVLDVGAGTGSHALILEGIGCKVDALEVSQTMISLMKSRGLKSTLNFDVQMLSSGEYDTILLMMNGLGLAGTLANLPDFLKHLKMLLNLGGQILADSSDISYLYEDDTILFPKDHYYGEVSYRYEYKGEKGDWFPWLYVDKSKLAETCLEVGLEMEVIFEDDNGQFLVRLLPLLAL